MPTDVLTSPRTFFIRLTTTEPSLNTPALIVILISLVSTTTGYLMGGLTEKLLPGSIEAITLITTTGTLIISFISPLLLWFGLTISLMLMSRLVKGTCEIRRVAEIAGYALMPLLIGSLISMALATYYIPGVLVQPVTSTDPDQVQAAVTAMMNSPGIKDYSTITALLTIILTIWLANIASIGLETCCNLTTGRALIAAGVPAILSIINTGFEIYNAYGAGI